MSGRTKFDALDPRRQLYLKHRSEGKNKLEAALAAGFSKAMARNAAAKIETADVRTAFRELMQAVAPAHKIAQRIAEGLDATETKFFQHEGMVTDSREAVAWSERRQYAELAAKYGGHVEEKTPGTNVQVAVPMLSLKIRDI